MRTVVFVAFDDFQLLDLAGPVEVLRTATHLGADPRYRTLVATVGGRPVRSESGVRLVADAAVEDLADGRGLPPDGDTAHAATADTDTADTDTADTDTVVVVGGVGAPRAARDPALLDGLAALSRRARRTASVCTGALVLAAAGLLDGHRATTHWSACHGLARRPGVQVLPDRIYVQDRDRWTSAGVTAGIDMFLALVERDGGAELAHAVAGWLVVFVRRPGGQAQFSAQLLAQPARTPGIVAVQRWLPDHVADDLSVEALARRALMSPRSFARAFRAETGITPAAFVEAIRVEAARRLLETTDLTVPAVAAAVGIRRPETFHRTFRRRVGTTPDRYRQHFGLRAS